MELGESPASFPQTGGKINLVLRWFRQLNGRWTSVAAIGFKPELHAFHKLPPIGFMVAIATLIAASRAPVRNRAA
jgi:hypothetical protein